MLLLQGKRAFSDFRVQKQIAPLALDAAVAAQVEAEFIYLVWLEKSSAAPTTAELERLCALLGASEATGLDKISTNAFFVTPRRGTLSPWSSKATDICRNCGFDAVSRVERIVAWSAPDAVATTLAAQVHDRMTETVFTDARQLEALNLIENPRPLAAISLGQDAGQALAQANNELGLALADDEIEYLVQRYSELNRDPSDIELMMFAQANSEHCRHKIFNASWAVDNEPMPLALFAMIRNTFETHPNDVLSAYRDNAAVSAGFKAVRTLLDATTRRYVRIDEAADILMKVETHNHPTGISPYPGAATGSGGEIRDEGATGRGGKAKAGLTGFAVSHLRLPQGAEPWETPRSLNPRLATALNIMLEAPIGAAAFNNEFGRPALTGYFRSFEHEERSGLVRGYDKPIMLAGGLGNVRRAHVEKKQLQAGDRIIVLGGPAMLIGLGGGAASSVDSGAIHAELDFASVQRDNAEMQRRCQQLIDACIALGDNNPIQSIHDVGAGGLSNAVPELLHDSERGGVIDLRRIPNAEPGLSPLEIWCNEAQERYVLGVRAVDVTTIEALCARERCPLADIGEVTAAQHLQLFDPLLNTTPIDLPMDVIFGKTPRMHRDVASARPKLTPFDISAIDLNEALDRVLRMPGVGDKRFLITIGDRSVGGLAVRDQMVGPWQVPVADCAVTAAGFEGITGEAMAIGERTPLALLDATAAARMTIAEAITNIAAARIRRIEDIVLSANWMCPAGHAGEDARLYEMVKTVGMSFCPELGINIPVGKDSMSMQSSWSDADGDWQCVAPNSLIISAFAPVIDVTESLTPELKRNEQTVLLLFDLGRGKNRLGGSCLAQAWRELGDEAADCNDAGDLKALFETVQLLNDSRYVLAYHDRSDGGLIVTLAEMAFAARCGLEIDLTKLPGDPRAVLFNEEPGAVIQIRAEDAEAVMDYIRNNTTLAPMTHLIARPQLSDQCLTISKNNTVLTKRSLRSLLEPYSSTTIAMQSLRDNPQTADEERAALLDLDDPGLSIHLPDSSAKRHQVQSVNQQSPRIAILREQGVNGHVEMAAAFTQAGFEAIDVHMTDVISGAEDLSKVHGLAVCGGFSYGDVLGAGRGWAGSIRFNQRARDVFAEFFARSNTFTLGVCNGCQMLAELRTLIPGSESWPLFKRNLSEQFEARLSLVEVIESNSVLLDGLAGLRAPVVVSHGEGRSEWGKAGEADTAGACLRYVTNHGEAAVTYPANPNGSPQGLTGFTSADGRATIMMPHPERIFLRQQMSWCPPQWRDRESPWMALFVNARRWVD